MGARFLTVKQERSMEVGTIRMSLGVLGWNLGCQYELSFCKRRSDNQVVDRRGGGKEKGKYSGVYKYINFLALFA